MATNKRRFPPLPRLDEHLIARTMRKQRISPLQKSPEDWPACKPSESASAAEHQLYEVGTTIGPVFKDIIDRIKAGLNSLPASPWLSFWIVGAANQVEIHLTHKSLKHDIEVSPLGSRKFFGKGSQMPITFEGFAQLYLEGTQFLLSQLSPYSSTNEDVPYSPPDSEHLEVISDLLQLAAQGAQCVDLWTACSVGWTHAQSSKDFQPSLCPYTKLWALGDRARNIQMMNCSGYKVPALFSKRMKQNGRRPWTIEPGNFPCLDKSSNTSGVLEYFARHFNAFWLYEPVEYQKQTITLEDMLKTWTFLAELSLEKIHSIYGTQETLQRHPERFIPFLEADHVISSISRFLNFDRGVATALVNVLTYTSKDIFAFPIIRQGNYLTMVYGPLLRSNPDRIIYRIMEKTGLLKDSNRGLKFANYLKQQVIKAIKEGPLKGQAWCCPIEFVIEDETGKDSVDIAFYVGGHLFLGEIRTCTFPGGSYEQEDHLTELLEKQGQIQGNVDRAKRVLSFINSKLAKEKLPPLTSVDAIHGIVITDKPFGLAFPGFPFAVIDSITLVQIFNNQDITSKSSKLLRSSSAKLISDFHEIIKNPPIAVASGEGLSLTHYGEIDDGIPPIRVRMWGYN